VGVGGKTSLLLSIRIVGNVNARIKADFNLSLTLRQESAASDNMREMIINYLLTLIAYY